MELEEFLPSKPEFTLASTGKTYELRLVNLSDHVWLKEKFGSSDAFSEMMRAQDWGRVIQFAYRLLVDKSDFMASTKEEIDDDGNIKTVMVTGPMKLLEKISGAEEAAKVMGALAKSIMLSNPMIDKLVKEQFEEDQKKSLTGLKSSTSSQVSTAGPQIQ